MKCIRNRQEGTSEGGVITRFSVIGHPKPSNTDRLHVILAEVDIGTAFGGRCGALITLDDSDFHMLISSASRNLMRRHSNSHLSCPYLDATFLTITELTGPTLSLSLTYITMTYLVALSHYVLGKLHPRLHDVEVRHWSR